MSEPNEITPPAAPPPVAPPTQTPPPDAVAAPPAAPPTAPPTDPLAALRAEIEAARSAAQRPQPQPAAPPPPQYQQPAPPAPPSINIEDLNRQFFQNPMGMLGAASQAAQAQATAQITNAFAPALIAQAKSVVRAEGGPIFDALEPEIEAAMANVDLTARTNPDTWRNAFYLVRGKYHDRLATLPTTARNAIVGGGPAPASVAAPPAPPAVQLSAEAARAAAGFGLSAEEYAQGVSDGVFILSNTVK